MLYSDWTTQISGFLPENLSDPNAAKPFAPGSRYNLVVDRAIEYAELRIYRDPKLDFLATRKFDYSTCTAGSRYVPLPDGFIVVEQLNIITPAGAAPEVGTRSPLLPVSPAFITQAWPDPTYQAPLQHFARSDNDTVIVGPVPSGAFVAEFYGTGRPAPLSSTNTQTFLSQYLPDLFTAATMIFFAGYQKTFGTVSGDPQQGMYWETYFTELRDGAGSEEARKMFRSGDWSALTSAAAPPPRA